MSRGRFALAVDACVRHPSWPQGEYVTIVEVEGDVFYAVDAEGATDYYFAGDTWEAMPARAPLMSTDDTLPADVSWYAEAHEVRRPILGEVYASGDRLVEATPNRLGAMHPAAVYPIFGIVGTRPYDRQSFPCQYRAANQCDCSGTCHHAPTPPALEAEPPKCQACGRPAATVAFRKAGAYCDECYGL